MYHFAFIRHCLILVGICFIAVSYANDVKPVNVYTYNIKPPYFIPSTENSTSKQEGIYVDFVDYLNAKQDAYAFELHFLPRIRLEKLLNNNSLDGVVIGVNPKWFFDEQREKYLWTNAIMQDRNVFLVNEIIRYSDYIKDEQFIGSKMALTRGTYHKGISELINEGKIELFSTSSDVQSLEMLIYNRVDATIMNPLTVNYFLKNNQLKKNFHILSTSHYEYERMIMIPKNQAEIFIDLSDLVQQAEYDKLWQDRFKLWGDE